MAQYLRTSSITSELENLIRDAKEKVYIISPYLKLSDNIRQLLIDKEREKVEVRIIFGKQELAPTEMEYLESLSYVRLYFFKNLHAKCYLNESKMIIASMNLYEFSQQYNREMGILIDTTVGHDKEVYEDAIRDVDSILHNSEDFSYVKAPKKEPVDEGQILKEKSSRKREKQQKNKNIGYCIRTGEEIEFNPDRPLSKEAFKSWNQYQNMEFSEQFCHYSGESSNGETSFAKPILRKNWKKAMKN